MTWLILMPISWAVSKIAGSGAHGHADLGLLDQGNKCCHQHNDEERRYHRHPLGLAAQ